MKLKPRNPDFVTTIHKKLEGQYFMKLVGFEITDIKAGQITGRLKVEQKHKQQHGFVHGGVTATLMDIVMGFAAYSLVEENQGVVTANLDVDFHHPGITDELEVIGKVDKPGKMLSFCSAEIYALNGEERTRIATAKSIMATIKGG
ncbi:PaaI family thioesterase [bacterium]|nr:PaaI family thioesterase [bacterium]